MPLDITGYVIEPARVGSANSPFTLTPNDFIYNSATFNAAYPTNESQPRTDYHVFVLEDGKFPDATFAWTKNEGIVTPGGLQVGFDRFGYQGQDQRFKTLPGGALELVGALALDSNTNRLKVTSAPVITDVTAFPARVSVGTGSGTSFGLTVVALEGDFNPSLPAGQVQLAQETGSLNWAAADLTTYQGQSVRFQQQAFFQYDKSSGRLGLIDEILLLNPIPATGQYPLLRIGFSSYLTPIQVANDAALIPAPASGSVKWSLATGRLAFNAGDASSNTGRPVYYDGACFGFGITVSTTSIGTVNSPGTVSVDENDDLFFRVSGVVQFPYTSYVDTLSSTGKRGVVEVRRSDGQVKFSLADRTSYGAQTAQAVRPNLTIERGINLRLFRTPVDLAAEDPTLKDVSAYYESSGAILADPIIEAPQVYLPAVPVDSLPIEVKVQKSIGDLVLPRLDVAVPPTGLGYVLDFEARQLLFAERKTNVVQTSQVPYGASQLSDPLVFSANLVLELETAPGSGVYVPLTLGEDALFEPAPGLASFVRTSGTLEAEGLLGSFSGATFTDPNASFVDILPGDLLVALSGGDAGVYTVTLVTGPTTLTVDVSGLSSTNVPYEIRRSQEILADRFFQVVPPVDPNTRVERVLNLGTTTNAPRLTIDTHYASGASRFRFGLTTFATVVLTVASDIDFTPPASLPAGSVEISLSTGHLNFSSVDVTAALDVYWFRTLTLGVEYTLQAPLGFIEFSERFLAEEEVFLQYKNANGVVQERGRFLVRKELLAHPAPTATLSFNLLGREVASTPVPKVYRGGRPQAASEVTVNTTASTITFLPSTQVTDALPAGAPVAPTENIYVDYYVYGALGGEQNLTVMQPPVQGVTVQISTDSPSNFTIAGNRTSVFASNTLLLVDGTEVYLIGSSSYDAPSGLTTITLQAPQGFRTDYLNPSLSVSSGETRVSSYLSYPSYFVTELVAYDSVPRGSSKLVLQGDLTRTYVPGVVVLFTNGGTLDFNLVRGSKYNEDTAKTEVTLASNGAKEYRSSSYTLKRSVRPIFETAQVATNTSRTPSSVSRVYRRTEGEAGTLINSPVDYTIDESGRFVLVEALGLREEVGILYTGYDIIAAGRNFRASYTHTVVPSLDNGLLDQVLKISYTTYVPDTVYWRVETMTNFRVEIAQSFEEAAKASVPSGGPILENSSAPRLYEQGQESVFFQEGHLANEDIVARATLKFFNDGVNLLEVTLRRIDGRVVGDRDGLFLFDGLIDNPPVSDFVNATNQIDDLIKVSDAPYTVTGPPFVATSVGTYRKAYEAAATSRFYPTKRLGYGVTIPPAGLTTGDTILDTGYTKLLNVSDVQRRSPWAVVKQVADIGDVDVYVDAARGAEELLRPGFNAEASIKVAIVDQDGTVLVNDASALTVQSTTSTKVTFTTSVPVVIPVGATLRLATTDTAYRKFYRVGTDVGADLENGVLTHVQPYPPLDGSVPGVPAELCIQNPAGGEVLDLTAALNNSLTQPFRFPALDGETVDDDGDRQLPVLSPQVASEDGSRVGGLDRELNVIKAAGGTLRAITTPSFVGTGSLDVARTTITNAGGAWVGTIPKVRDLVRIRSGSNQGSDFRRITVVGASTITVNTAFAVQDNDFEFTVTVSDTLLSGTTGVLTTNSLTDLSVDFVAAGVKPGHTLVVTNGVNDNLRRQVTTVVSTTELTITPLTADLGPVTYRVDDPLGTFGYSSSLVISELIDSLDSQTIALPDQISYLQDFLELMLSDLFTSSNGETTLGDPTFTDLTVDFVAAGVSSRDYVYIQAGTTAGIYKVLTVDTPNTLTIDGTFPATATGISYRLVWADLASRETLESVVATQAASAQAYLEATSFFDLATTPITVLGDASAYALDLVSDDLDARELVINNRQTALETSGTGFIAILSGIMSSGDRYYDQRHSWIDSRINLETGILVKQQRAVENRLKAQEEILNQLLKLLAT